MGLDSCKECGAAIPADWSGFCAQCLLGLGLRKVKNGECRVQNEDDAGVDPASKQAKNAGCRVENEGAEEVQGPKSEVQSQGTATIVSLNEKAGVRIGRYRLLEEIGHGGCGVVYMAEQEEPVRRKVALKVIK